MNWKENLDKLRRWIDVDAKDEAPENIIKAHENKSESELFLQKLLNSVEDLLKQEIIRIPNTNKAYVPEKFMVYISAEADKTLRDDKRKFFEQSLNALIHERAKELAGRLELTAKKLEVEILINALLEDNEIEVKIGSNNEQLRNQTIQFVLSKEGSKVSSNENAKLDKTFDFSKKDEKTDYEIPLNNLTVDDIPRVDNLATVDDFEGFSGILYRVEIWQNGKRINELPIIQRQVTIGRDDADKVANLRLPTDNRKISRTHAELRLEENGEIWVTALHKNPTIVSGKPISNNEWAKVEADGEIQVYDFTIKVKFPN